VRSSLPTAVAQPSEFDLVAGWWDGRGRADTGTGRVGRMKGLIQDKSHFHDDEEPLATAGRDGVLE
jgi:hypothetical protein